MAQHNLLGKAGEEAAVKFLQTKGYHIRHCNWRKRHLELDIVAEKNGELVVLEVKTRTDTTYIQPQDAVGPTKIKRTVIAADAYLKKFKLDMPVRFDIISVVGKDGHFTIEHIEEAFYPPLF